MKSFSLNELAKKQQFRNLVIVLSILCSLVFLFFQFFGGHKSNTTPKGEGPKIASVISHDFSKANTKSALKAQEQDISKMNTQITELSKSLADAMRKKEADDAALKSQMESLRAEKIKIGAVGSSLSPSDREKTIRMSKGPITSHHFQYAMNNILSNEQKSKSVVPSGSFAEAVILGGADANASVNGQSDASPMLFRIMDAGTLPGGKRSDLKDCHVTASVYGDISSERGMVRLQRLSCNKKSGSLDIKVTGWAFFKGKNGIKGHAVMRNGDILWTAGISGLFSGFGEGVKTAQTTQSLSALGSVSSVEPSSVLTYGAFNGIGTAFSKLSDYYIKRADQYHPVIEIGAGNIVTLVFTEPFSIDPKQQGNFKVSMDSKADQDEIKIPKSIVNNIQNAHLSPMGAPR